VGRAEVEAAVIVVVVEIPELIGEDRLMTAGADSVPGTDDAGPCLAAFLVPIAVAAVLQLCP
jgi:hypothetical protein